MQELIEDLVSRPVWAVVGFSENPAKFGNILYFDLKRAGYQVFPVNRGGGTVAGDTIYTHVGALPEKVDVVSLVVPPEEGIKVVRECLEQGLRRIWLQPGAESSEIIEFCRKHRMQMVFGACAMIRKKRMNDSPRTQDTR